MARRTTTPPPSVLIDIADYLDAKITALAAHRSQAGRYYLSEPYTCWRAATEGWTSLPCHAAAGRSFEAFTPSLLLLHSAPDPTPDHAAGVSNAVDTNPARTTRGSR